MVKQIKLLNYFKVNTNVFHYGVTLLTQKLKTNKKYENKKQHGNSGGLPLLSYVLKVYSLLIFYLSVS